MIQIDITHDTEQMIAAFGELSRRQIPFATSGAINDTIFNVRKRIITRTYPRSFDVKNKVFPARLWRVIKKAKKGDLEAIFGHTKLHPGSAEDMELHAKGGTKTGKRGRIAIPVEPAKVRSPTGRVRKGNRPRNLKNKVEIKKGTRTVILQRRKKKLIPMYVVSPTAKIRKTFRFEEDAVSTSIRAFPYHMARRFAQATRSSKFEQR